MFSIQKTFRFRFTETLIFVYFGVRYAGNTSAVAYEAGGLAGANEILGQLRERFRHTLVSKSIQAVYFDKYHENC